MTQVNRLLPLRDLARRPRLFKPEKIGSHTAATPREQPQDQRVSGFVALLSQAHAFEPRLLIQYASQAMAEDPSFDSKLVDLIQRGECINSETAIRILRGLDSFCPKPRLLGHLLRLKSLDGRVRSKVTLILGRLVQNPNWLREQLRDPNPRVRANAIEALWGVIVPGVEQLLWEATNDSNNRVVANAAVGLYKLGSVQCIPVIQGLLRSKQEMFRRSGLFAIVQTKDVRYLKAARRHLKAQTAEERNWAELAIKTITDHQRRTAFLSQIDIELRDIQSHVDGLRVATLSCVPQTLSRWMEPTDFNPLDFIVTDAGRQVENHTLRPLTTTEPLSTIILFPAGCLSSPQLFHEMRVNGRELEKIALIPYHSSDTVLSALNQEDELRVVFDNQTDNLIGQFERGDVRIAESLSDALLRSAQALQQMEGWRHIVVLLDPCTRVTVSPLALAALEGQSIQVHSVIAEDADPDSVTALEKLSQTFSGLSARSRSVEDLRHLLLSIRVGQFGLFELSWTTPKPGASAITINCCSRVGSGAVSFQIAGEANDSQEEA